MKKTLFLLLISFASSNLFSQEHDTLPLFDRSEMVKMVISNPSMIDVIKEGAGFGGDFSRHVGANIFS